jgi:hypothetical protein
MTVLLVIAGLFAAGVRVHADPLLELPTACTEARVKSRDVQPE